MTGRERFFAGILGALMPICAIVLTLDMSIIFDENSGLSTGQLIGIVIQFIIFLFVGGTVAYMHSDEVKAYKLFQIGMATPALLASFTTSNGLNSAMDTSVELASPTVVESPSTSENSFNFSIISPANASDDFTDTTQYQQLAMGGQESIIQQIFQGVTGSAYGTATNKTVKKPTNKTQKKPTRNKDSKNVINSNKSSAAKILMPDSVSPTKDPVITSSSPTISSSVAAPVVTATAPVATMLMAVEEPAADMVAVEELSAVAATSSPTVSLSVNSESEDRYDQLIKKLE